jgi:hypothetical protein
VPPAAAASDRQLTKQHASIDRSICQTHARTYGWGEPTAPLWPRLSVTTAYISFFLTAPAGHCLCLADKAPRKSAAASGFCYIQVPGPLSFLPSYLDSRAPWLGLQPWGCAVWQNLSFHRRPLQLQACRCALDSGFHFTRRQPSGNGKVRWFSLFPCAVLCNLPQNMT